jgi:hypothetical protein
MQTRCELLFHDDRDFTAQDISDAAAEGVFQGLTGVAGFRATM